MSIDREIIEIAKKRAKLEWEYYSVDFVLDEKDGAPFYLFFNELEMVDGVLQKTGERKGVRLR